MKKIISTLFLSLGLFTKAFCNGYPVFDVSNWLQGLDTFYTTYDMLMNTITQIENQYKQIQQAVENAKSIDWDNIEFEGGFDIREDIKKVNRRVNRSLTQANRIKDALTQETLQVGDNRYSVADLCGQGKEGKNLARIGGEYIGFLSSNAQKSISKMEKGLTKNQKEAIWQKYGISPKNYLLVDQTKNFFKEEAQKLIQKVQPAITDLEKTEEEKEDSTLEQAVTSQTDSNGNVTEGANNEGTRTLLYRLKETFKDFIDDFNGGVAMYCSKVISEEAEKETNKDAAKTAAETTANQQSKVGSNFKK